MEKIKLKPNDSLCAIGKQIDVDKARKLSALEKYLRNLLHASQCDEANCQLANCRAMKRIFHHSKKCEKGASACLICKRLVSVCCFHARNCPEIDCPVPFCANIKLRLAQKRPARANIVRRKLAATSIQQMESVRERRVCRLKEHLRQLVDILKSPNTLEKQNRIFDMLKNDRSLVSALVKLRQTLALERSASQRSENQQQRAQPRGEWLKHQQRLFVERQQLAMENRRQPSESAVQRLVHASQCSQSNCRLVQCRKMKRVVHHIKTCQRRTSGGCSVCKQIVALCCNHVKHCLEDDCAVPFCLSIKRKLEARRCDHADRAVNHEVEL